MKSVTLFLLFTINTFSQNWINIPGTSLIYSNFLKKDSSNYTKFQLEYFKKGDDMIAVQHFLSKDLYDLLQNDPRAFDDLYKASPRTVHKEEWLDQKALYKEEWDQKTVYKGVIYADTTILAIPFKRIIFINDCSYIRGYKEFLWVLEITSGNNLDLGMCYMNMVFKIRKHKHRKIKYLATVKSYCEI